MRSTIKKPLKYIFPVIILLPVILFFQSCASFGYTEEEVFTSPQGLYYYNTRLTFGFSRR